MLREISTEVRIDMGDPSAKPKGRSIKPKPRKFYVLGPNLLGGGKGHGLVFANEDKLRTPPRLIVRPAEGGFPVLREKPHIVHDKKEGNAPRDLESSLSGYWFISERLKQIFETVDPEGFAFAECDYTLSDGSKGPRHYLCDVVRTLDALDEDRSKVKISFEPSGRKLYSVAGGASLVFKESFADDSHIFIQPGLGTDPICDSILRDACKAIPDLKGIRFRDASKL